MGHVHNVTWRLDVDLDGSTGDTVSAMSWQRALFGKKASHVVSPWSYEGGAVWKPENFLSWKIADSRLRNSHGNASEYHLMPVRWGNQRHQEAYLNKDLWVTRYRWEELSPRLLPRYTAPREWVAGSDVVLWYTSGFYHHPRPEDGVTVGSDGATHVMWATVTLKPWGLFDGTPLYP